MIAVGIVSAGFQGPALSVAAERHDGTLKRLRGTPMPPAAYLLGMIVQVFLVSLTQVAVLLVAGTWELARVALVLAAWGVIALVVWIRTFEWSGNER